MCAFFGRAAAGLSRFASPQPLTTPTAVAAAANRFPNPRQARVIRQQSEILAWDAHSKIFAVSVDFFFAIVNLEKASHGSSEARAFVIFKLQPTRGQVIQPHLSMLYMPRTLVLPSHHLQFLETKTYVERFHLQIWSPSERSRSYKHEDVNRKGAQRLVAELARVRLRGRGCLSAGGLARFAGPSSKSFSRTSSVSSGSFSARSSKKS